MPQVLSKLVQLSQVEGALQQFYLKVGGTKSVPLWAFWSDCTLEHFLEKIP